jgi:hypothetical protein
MRRERPADKQPLQPVQREPLCENKATLEIASSGPSRRGLLDFWNTFGERDSMVQKSGILSRSFLADL